MTERGRPYCGAARRSNAQKTMDPAKTPSHRLDPPSKTPDAPDRKPAQPPPKLAECPPKLTGPSLKLAEAPPKLAECPPKLAEPPPKLAESSPKLRESSPRVVECPPDRPHALPRVAAATIRPPHPSGVVDRGWRRPAARGTTRPAREPHRPRWGQGIGPQRPAGPRPPTCCCSPGRHKRRRDC